jgi:energy-coupling factor transporter transmembrane protein EcfT
MATTPTVEIIRAMSRLLNPFEKIGVPVKDFFHIMGLTIQCFPLLKNAIARHYRENVQKSAQKGIVDKARLIAFFLLPLIVESIRSPEHFFGDSTTA